MRSLCAVQRGLRLSNGAAGMISLLQATRLTLPAERVQPTYMINNDKERQGMMMAGNCLFSGIMKYDRATKKHKTSEINWHTDTTVLVAANWPFL